MKKTYFAILGAAAILSLATACSSKNVNEPTANESSQSASSESSSNGMDESSPMDDLKEEAKDAVLPSEGTADAKQSTMTGTISDIKDFMFTITADGTDYEFSFEQDQKPDGLSDVKDGDKVLSELKLAVNVKNRTLPASTEWAFHLDLWQNPYAEARYYNVEPFSKEHFDRMRPDMQNYVDAGGKVITASIMHKPWNGQTYDPFESMVTWLKKADGTWYFDYTVFDKWVEYMMSLGVKKQINCYSMVPWRLSFQYFDQASNSFKYLDVKPGEAAYDEFWGNMLTSFAKHLKEKGWFDITHISMDERPMKDMLATLKVIRKADKDFKVSLAGTYHDELVKELHDYCIAIGEKFPAEVIKSRKEAGQVTTYYTCCTEPRPNTFTFSAPAEAEWLGWFAAKENLDGYLRWALNSWVKNPLQDSRFTAWAAGDTYMIYPEGRSSIRFERLIEGIQSYEKIRILKEEFEKKGNKSAIKKIDKILKAFDEFSLEEIPAATVVTKAKEAINKY